MFTTIVLPNLRSKLMNMLEKIITAILILICLPTMAQDMNSDVESISNTIQNYFNGYIQRDSVQLYKAFDSENGVMKVPSMNSDGTEQVDNVYFKELLPKWSNRDKLPQSVLDDSELKILNIDVSESEIGSAKILMKVGDDTYIDILSLQKINEEWKITNKIYLVLENE